jgi:hydroxypyruvate reductase
MEDRKTTTDQAIEIWNAGVAAVDAEKLTADAISLTPKIVQVAGRRFELAGLDTITVIGFGKCSGLMAAGVESALRNLPNRINLRGLVNVPQGQVAKTNKIELAECRDRASNFPTEAVVQQTGRMLKMVQGAGKQELVIVLVSGGGSALLEDPLVPLEDLVAVSKAISARGAPIESLNTVRRSLSSVKAGGLARCLLGRSAASVAALVISDVIGDDLAMVASGPTVLDKQSLRQRFQAAGRVIENLPPEEVPASVKNWLNQSEAGAEMPAVSFVQTFAPQDRARIDNHLLANNATALEAAKSFAGEIGYRVQASDLCVNRDVVEVAKDWVDVAFSYQSVAAGQSVAVIAGGEPTVKLSENPGCGGRNLQLAALVMQGLLDRGWPTDVNIAFVSGGSDGEDGTASVSGGGFDSQALRSLMKSDLGSTAQQHQSESLRKLLKRCIARNDCFGLFEELGRHVPPPAVSTNVCDVQLMLIG